MRMSKLISVRKEHMTEGTFSHVAAQYIFFCTIKKRLVLCRHYTLYALGLNTLLCNDLVCNLCVVARSLFTRLLITVEPQ